MTANFLVAKGLAEMVMAELVGTARSLAAAAQRPLATGVKPRCCERPPSRGTPAHPPPWRKTVRALRRLRERRCLLGLGAHHGGDACQFPGEANCLRAADKQ